LRVSFVVTVLYRYIRDGTVPAYAFLVNVRSSLAENLTKHNTKRNETRPIFTIWQTFVRL
jgi:hypothetical protein